MGLSGVIPANYLTTQAFQALSPVQQAASTGAEYLSTNRQTLINSLLGLPSSTAGTSYTGIGVTGSYSTTGQAVSASGLQAQQQSQINLLTSYGGSGTIGGYAPTTFAQMMLLQALIRNGSASLAAKIASGAGNAGAPASPASPASATTAATTSAAAAVAAGRVGQATASAALISSLFGSSSTEGSPLNGLPLSYVSNLYAKNNLTSFPSTVGNLLSETA